ncbi:ras-related protein Rab-22A-like [Dysidea avara]|uniref:ras-related protein Rab-22A-like n=1 Tax=Dysidea avara TaxID=196820 RepID=UPI00332052B1
MTSQSQYQEAKICLLGDMGVGKSSLVGRFVHDKFDTSLTTTLGASFMSKTVSINDKTYRFQIWDTAGQERYRSLLPMYYRNAAAAIVVYDITNQATFNVLRDWIRELQKLGPPNIVLAIAGNKSDLTENREISTEEGKGFAEEIGAVFSETSALTATNVAELFVEIGKRLPTEAPPTLRTSQASHTVTLNKTSKGGHSCCSQN